MTIRVRSNAYLPSHADRDAAKADSVAADDAATTPAEPEFVPLYPPTRAYKVLHPLRARKHGHNFG